MKTCQRCGGCAFTKHRHCKKCHRLSREKKREQRWRGVNGQTPAWYTTLKAMGRGYGKAIEAKRAEARPKRRTPDEVNAMIERMRVEQPHRYDPTVPRNVLAFRARYLYDHTFREYQVHKARAREYDRDGASDGTLTPSVLRRLFARAKDCPYCHVTMRSQDKSLDHIVPLARGGKHSITNVVVACLRCNMAKSAKMLEPRDIANMRHNDAA